MPAHDPPHDPPTGAPSATTAEFVDWLRHATTDPENPAVPAATVVVLRDAPAGLEVLMMHKASKMAFGEMWVFPGGRIDPADHADRGPDPADEGADRGTGLADLAAARRAACREAAEEAGLELDEAALVHHSFWLPPPQAPKRFATWFFLAPAPAGAAGRVEIDHGEIQDHRWIAPAEALRLRDKGEIDLAPPTWVTLWNLAAFERAADAIEHCRNCPPERFETHVAVVEGGVIALWEGDAGYHTYEAEPDAGTADPAATGPRHRLVMVGDAWRYERTV